MNPLSVLKLLRLVRLTDVENFCRSAAFMPLQREKSPGFSSIQGPWSCWVRSGVNAALHYSSCRA